MSDLREMIRSQPMAGRRVALVGKLGGVTKQEAKQLIRHLGGIPVDQDDPALDLLVIGAEELPLVEERLLDESTRQAAAEHRLEILTETQLWQQLGLVDSQQHVHRLYTPAMLAELLGVSIAIIRRWHRRGLIVPVREVNRLPYFDFQEVATARRLAQLLAAGASPTAIEQRLEQLARLVPEVDRPLAQLSVIVQGRRLLLRTGEGLIEPGGQLHFDFASLDESAREAEAGGTDAAVSPSRLNEPDAAAPESLGSAIEGSPGSSGPFSTPDEVLQQAAELEDGGHLRAAVDAYRAFLMAYGPHAEACFSLAELLYRLGDLSAARERYYVAVELDEDYVEARANLGCVLAELGQVELAIAAFHGALQYHADYPDVHYHLARLLDDAGRSDEAVSHWKAFVDLAPDSPWAEAARQRLEPSTPP